MYRCASGVGGEAGLVGDEREREWEKGNRKEREGRKGEWGTREGERERGIWRK